MASKSQRAAAPGKVLILTKRESVMKLTDQDTTRGPTPRQARSALALAGDQAAVLAENKFVQFRNQRLAQFA